jgi:hypothetical protein
VLDNSCRASVEIKTSSGKKSRHFWRFGFDIFDQLLTNFKKLTWGLQYINDQISEGATPKMVTEPLTFGESP